MANSYDYMSIDANTITALLEKITKQEGIRDWELVCIDQQKISAIMRHLKAY